MASPITPRRGRGKSKKSIDLVDAAVAILTEIQPASVRAVCYRLFTLGLIEHMGKNCTDKVSKQLVWAREQGLIKWSWIVDETRAAERITTWAEPNEIIQAAVDGYRRDYWQDQPYRVEVWSEKGTVRGTLGPVLREYGVTFRVMHGYGSATSIYAAAQDSLIGDKSLTVLYVGDWDPSGLHMSECDLPARLERYGGEVAMHRIALKADDVAPGTTIPHFSAVTKNKDPRYQWFADRYGNKCWELDALSPVILRKRADAAIRALIDLERWDHAIQVEIAERESMATFLDTWNALISQPAANCSGARDGG